MRHARSLLLWLLAGAAGLILLIWAYPLAFPFIPRPWSVSRAEAVAIALERFRDLGEPVKDPYVVVLADRDFLMERRLQLVRDHSGASALRASGLPDRVVFWRVRVYPRGAQRDEWAYTAKISFSGAIQSLRRRFDPQAPGVAISPQEARARADAFLTQQGIDLSRYGQPEIRSQQLAKRTDLAVRYPDRRNPLTGGSTHGIEVLFAGDQIAGYGPWLEDPHEKELTRSVQSFGLLGIIRVVWILLLAVLLAFPFLKRYHEGEIGVRRGAEVFLVVGAAGLVLMLLRAA